MTQRFSACNCEQVDNVHQKDLVRRSEQITRSRISLITLEMADVVVLKRQLDIELSFTFYIIDERS